MDEASVRDTIRDVSRELNYPSAAKLRAALLRRGVRVSLQQVRDFTKGQVSRQVFRRVPAVFGRIAATGLNHRWAADLVDYTASPDGKWQHVLVVQDIYSRKLFTAPLERNDPDEVLRAFRSFVRAEGEPHRVDTDAGPEFTKNFAEYLDVHEIPHIVKDPSDTNALGTLDRAIMTLKQDLARVMTEEETDDWAKLLPRVTKGYNDQQHSSLFGAAPSEVKGDKNVRFDLNKKALEDLQVNDHLAQKRAKELQEAGAYRVAAKRDKFKRSFQPNWSSEVRTLGGLSMAYAVDSEGGEVLAKRTLPVPAGTANARLPRVSLPGSAQTDQRYASALEPFKARIREFVSRSDGGALLENVAVHMKGLGVPKIPGKTVRATLEFMGFRVAPRSPTIRPVGT